MYELEPRRVAHDLHPDYVSTQFARDSGFRTTAVQHHEAHVLACIAEHSLPSPVLGFAWDGAGLGHDGAVWGGEAFLVEEERVSRVAHPRPFALPGGEAAIREPWRAALGLLFAYNGGDLAPFQDLPCFAGHNASARHNIETMLRRGLNAPLTTSVGRLFDAVSAMVGLRRVNRFEGEAAMALEFALDDHASAEPAYPHPELRAASPTATDPLVWDWSPMLEALLEDLRQSVPVAKLAARVHNTLVDLIIVIARTVRAPRVVLTGGCFLNAYLLNRAIDELRAAGLEVYWPQRLPPGDGAIAFGQVAAVARMKQATES